MSDSVSYQMSRPQKPKSWWIEKVPKRKKTFFANSLKDFLRSISLHGYGKMVEEKSGIGERIIWFMVHIMTLTVLLCFLKYTMSTIADNFYITLYDPLYPIEKVPFPTVSICSINRISNASAWQFAVELSKVDPRKRDPVYFYDNIRMLAYLYKSNEAIEFDKAVFFQGYLDLFGTDDNDVFFNTRKRMKLLTPKCGQMLRACHLGGRQIDCNNEFVTSLTAYGFCCTFNRGDKYSKRSENMSFYGPTQGLTVVLKSNPNDSFYNIIDIEGFTVMVHQQNLYGDVAAGGVSETFISSQMESFIAITPKITDSVTSIRYYSPRLRSCYFENEFPKIYGESYNLNRCISRCRIRSIIALCECLPFYYPYYLLDTTTQTVHCTLQHLECLNRYEFLQYPDIPPVPFTFANFIKLPRPEFLFLTYITAPVKWMNVITQRQTVRGLEREMEDGLYCPECLPSCSDIQYKVSLMSLPLDHFRYVLARTYNFTATDLTRLHLYFGEPTVPFYRRIIKNSALEIFSTVGNICGVVTGFSLVAVCEILYFFGGELIVLLWHLFMVDHSKGGRNEGKLIICP